MNNCIICGSRIVRQCKCMRGDATCENGHSYHWSPYHKEYHMGISDHKTPTDSPDCCESKLVIDKEKKVIKFEDHTTISLDDPKLNPMPKEEFDASKLTQEEIISFLRTQGEPNGVVENIIEPEEVRHIIRSIHGKTLKQIMGEANFEEVYKIMDKSYPHLVIDNFIYKTFYHSLLELEIEENNQYAILIENDNDSQTPDYVVYLEDPAHPFLNGIVIPEDYTNTKWLGFKVSSRLHMTIEEVTAHMLVYLFNTSKKDEHLIIDTLKEEMADVVNNNTLIDSLKQPMINVMATCDGIDSDNVSFSIVFKKPPMTEEDENANGVPREERIQQYLDNANIKMSIDELEYEIPVKTAKDEELMEIFQCSVLFHFLTNEAFRDAAAIIYERKVIEYCKANKLETAEGLIPGDNDIYTFKDFKNEYPEISDILEKEAIEEAKIVTPIGTEFFNK